MSNRLIPILGRLIDLTAVVTTFFVIPALLSRNIKSTYTRTKIGRDDLSKNIYFAAAGTVLSYSVSRSRYQDITHRVIRPPGGGTVGVVSSTVQRRHASLTWTTSAPCRSSIFVSLHAPHTRILSVFMRITRRRLRVGLGPHTDITTYAFY